MNGVIDAAFGLGVDIYYMCSSTYLYRLRNALVKFNVTYLPMGYLLSAIYFSLHFNVACARLTLSEKTYVIMWTFAFMCWIARIPLDIECVISTRNKKNRCLPMPTLCTVWKHGNSLLLRMLLYYSLANHSNHIIMQSYRQNRKWIQINALACCQQN